MKIGILTQPLLNNYGGLLQNYALQQVLKTMGHEVETVDWDQNTEPVKAWLSGCKQRLLWLIDKKVGLPRYRPTAKETDVILSNTRRFVEHNISVCSKKAKSLDDFKRIGKTRGYQAYVVGSDQVWRTLYNPLQPAMFLSFAEDEDVIRIAYAASFGISSWGFSPDLTQLCARLAKKFDLITVREESGVELCRKYLGVDAIRVLDPTMLLNKEDYIRIVENEKETDSAGTLFHYILDPCDEKKKLIDSLGLKLKMKPFTVMPKCQVENRTKWDVKNKIEDCVFPSVSSWLRGFIDAKIVIVDSFHGAVFSIIFNKPFWVLANAKRGNARFESLLGMYGLEDRMITMESIGKDFSWNKSIDWNRVNEVRNTETARCKSLLENALNKNVCQR